MTALENDKSRRKPASTPRKRAAKTEPDAVAAPSGRADAPPRNRQHERSQMSTARLLAAAADLFAESGYRQTSLADIGKKAGYSHGLVTRRFGSKQGLLVSLLDYMIDNWMQRALLPSLGNQNGIAAIRAFYSAFCSNSKANSSNLRALESLMFEGLWGEPELKQRLTVVQQVGHERFKQLIVRGLESGDVRADVDADAVAMMASTALRGATYRWLLEDDFDLCGALTAFGDVLEVVLKPA